MTDVRVRNLDDDIVALLKDRARMNGRTLENELREALTELAMRSRRELAGELREMRNDLREKYGTFSDSVALIREERDRRG